MLDLLVMLSQCFKSMTVWGIFPVAPSKKPVGVVFRQVIYLKQFSGIY